MGGLYIPPFAGTLCFDEKIRPKCCTILVWVAACLNSSNILLMSRHTIQKKVEYFLTFFGDRYIEKEEGLSTHRTFAQPDCWISRRFGRIFVLIGSELWTPVKNSFLNLSNTKYIGVDVLFWAYPMVSLSCWSVPFKELIVNFSAAFLVYIVTLYIDIWQ